MKKLVALLFLCAFFSSTHLHATKQTAQFETEEETPPVSPKPNPQEKSDIKKARSILITHIDHPFKKKK